MLQTTNDDDGALVSTRESALLFLEDDEYAARATMRVLREALTDLTICHTPSLAEGLAYIQRNHPEVVLLDLSLAPNEDPSEGIERIGVLLGCDPTLQVVALTGYKSSEMALRALELGASTYLTKPVQPTELTAIVRDRIRAARIRRTREQLRTANSIPGLLGDSDSMQAVAVAARRAATNRIPLLILGETGTGKSLLAKGVHSMQFASGAPFVRYAPTFASHDLVLSELFGHTKGAFTGANEPRRGLIEEAHRGTLFLDEISELPESVQIMLLETIQSKEYRRLGSNAVLRSDFRFIAATNVTREALTSKLRPDFSHRIGQTTIAIPPLRERKSDIPRLARAMLREYASSDKIPVYDIAEPALVELTDYEWPGNVRELQAVVCAAAADAHFHRQNIVLSSHFDGNFRKRHGEYQQCFRDRVKQFETGLIRSALAACNDNQARAAALLQMDRGTMRRVLSRKASGERES